MIRRLFAVAALAGACAAAYGAVGANAPAAPQIEIKGAVARVVITPEPRGELAFRVIHANPRLPLKIVRQGHKLIIDGGLGRDRVRACRVQAGPAGVTGGSVRVTGLGEAAWADLPQIEILAPPSVRVSASGAVFGAVGRSQALELFNDGCGDWTVADVQGRLRVSQAGAGSTWAGRAGSAQLRVAGSGGVAMGAVSGGANIDMAGSGAVKVASIDGPLDVRIAGSGGVLISGGRATAMTASVAGAGGVVFNGVARSLKASIAGSGDIRAAKVTGPVTRRTIGSGKVVVGG